MSLFQGPQSKLFGSRRGRDTRAKQRARCRVAAEALEGRALLTSLVVNGDQLGASNDVILLHRNTSNANFAEVQVNNIVISNTPISSLTDIKINGLEGNDTINIEDTFANVPVTINGGNGNDTINISPTAKNLAHIQGSVTINGDAGFDTVIVNDQNNAAAATYTVTATQVTRPGAAPINFAASENLTLNGGSAANIYNVESTAASTPATIVSRAANDTFNLSPTAHNLNTLASVLVVSDGGGSDSLNVNDQSNAAVTAYSLNASVVSRSGPANAQVNFFGVENVTVGGGSAADSYAIDSTAANVTMAVNGGASNDTFAVTPFDRNLSDLAGNLRVNGGGGTDSLAIDDQNFSSGVTYSLTSTQLTRPGAASVSYTGVEALTLNGGTGSDTYRVESTLPATTIVAGSNLFNSNSILIAPTLKSLNAIQGSLSFVGGFSFDSVVVNDQNNPTPTTYTLTSTKLTRPGAAAINFSGNNNLSLFGGSRRQHLQHREHRSVRAGDACRWVVRQTRSTSARRPSNLSTIAGKVTIQSGNPFDSIGGPVDTIVVNDQNNPSTTYIHSERPSVDPHRRRGDRLCRHLCVPATDAQRRLRIRPVHGRKRSRQRTGDAQRRTGQRYLHRQPDSPQPGHPREPIDHQWERGRRHGDGQRREPDIRCHLRGDRNAVAGGEPPGHDQLRHHRGPDAQRRLRLERVQRREYARPAPRSRSTAARTRTCSRSARRPRA